VSRAGLGEECMNDWKNPQEKYQVDADDDVSRLIHTMLPLDVHVNLKEYAMEAGRAPNGTWTYGTALRKLLEYKDWMIITASVLKEVGELRERIIVLEAKKVPESDGEPDGFGKQEDKKVLEEE